jgi:hypothetical protein
MDVNAVKPAGTYPSDLKKLIKTLTISSKLELKGSASLASQKFPADFDFYCVLHLSEIDKIKDVIDRIEQDPNLYFIELKEQKGAKKKKYYHKEKLKLNQPDFVKIDLVAWFDNQFVEASCIYQFTVDTQSTEDYINSLESDIKELKKQKRWYKILKRQFTIYKAKGDKKRQLELTKIFNSDIGKKYQVVSNVEALILVLENYTDKKTLQKVKLNLKELDGTKIIEDPYAFVKSESKFINDFAHQVFDKLND